MEGGGGEGGVEVECKMSWRSSDVIGCKLVNAGIVRRFIVQSRIAAEDVDLFRLY